MNELVLSSDFDLATISNDAVQALELELLKLPQVEIVTDHIFEDGMYIRRITVPPWTVLTGAPHKTSYPLGS